MNIEHRNPAEKIYLYKTLPFSWNSPHFSMASLSPRLLYEELLDQATTNDLLSLLQTPVSFLITTTCSVLRKFYLSCLPN